MRRRLTQTSAREGRQRERAGRYAYEATSLSDLREFFNAPYPVPSQDAGSHLAQAILRIRLMGKQAGIACFTYARESPMTAVWDAHREGRVLGGLKPPRLDLASEVT